MLNKINCQQLENFPSVLTSACYIDLLVVWLTDTDYKLVQANFYNKKLLISHNP